MRCWTTKGLIPLMSLMDQPITSLFALRTSISWVSSSSVKSEAITTGKVSDSTRYEYFKVSGRGFNSTLGGFWTSSDTVVFGNNNGSNWDLYFGVSMIGVESSKTLTSLI